MTIVEGAIMALTLLDRKKARVEEIRAGFTRLREELAGYGATHGGRFLIFGSAATGRFHYESDIDIIVDFKGPPLRSALDFVESACARLRLKADIRPISWSRRRFSNEFRRGLLSCHDRRALVRGRRSAFARLPHPTRWLDRDVGAKMRADQ